uniref:Uncharacterized protein n=1 Tax=Eutreptiella gymnastica TaxID=73025 RepID=A0A7S4FDM0_9EUGL
MVGPRPLPPPLTSTQKPGRTKDMAVHQLYGTPPAFVEAPTPPPQERWTTDWLHGAAAVQMYDAVRWGEIVLGVGGSIFGGCNSVGLQCPHSTPAVSAMPRPS